MDIFSEVAVRKPGHDHHLCFRTVFLDVFKDLQPAPVRKANLESFIGLYGSTASGGEARQLLEEIKGK